MFEGIPDSAFCSLYVLRGDVEMLNSDGVSLNVVAETHDSLNFCSLYVLRGDVEMLNSDGVSLNVVAETHDSLNFVLIRNVVENEE